MSGMEQRREARTTSRISDAIGIARLVCVLGVVYVHGWTGLNGDGLTALAHTPQGRLRWALIELLGRNAVPLLGMISGWLAVGSLERRSWRPFLAGKARTILAPMVAWNAIAIVLVGGFAMFGHLRAPVPHSGWWVIDELFCLVTPDDINVQMPFLRDLFLCMCAAPLLARLPTRGLFAVAGGALIWSLLPIDWIETVPILLRPQILLFFTLGMVVRRERAAPWLAERPIAIAATAFVALAYGHMLFDTGGATHGAAHAHALLAASLDIVMRLAAAWLCWSLAWRLANGRARAPLLALEPYVFLLFCVHLVMIWLLGPVIGLATGPMGSRAYPLFLLLQPALAMGGAILIGRALNRYAPAAADLLSGGRLGERRSLSRAPAMPARPASA